MVGNWIWNAWFSLAGFSYYFLSTFQKGEPLAVLLESFSVGILFFFLMYVVRAIVPLLIGNNYDHTTPVINEEEKEMNGNDVPSEDIAKVVQSYLQEDEQKTS